MTTVELVVALFVFGILTTAAAQTSARWADRIAVESAQSTVLNAYRRAQSAARVWGRPAEITVGTDSIVVRTVGVSDTVVLWRGPGPARTGVLLTPANHLVSFAPTGLATGAANVNHVFQRGGIVRTVVVSRLGRFRAR